MNLRKLIILTFGLGLFLYLVSFAFLTASGGYTLMPSGTFRPLNGLAIADTWV